METKEEKVRERIEREAERERQELEGHDNAELLTRGKARKNDGVRKSNRLWLWLGVLILIFILLWWLWSIGMFEDLTGISNG